jgi:hypothetical protein
MDTITIRDGSSNRYNNITSWMSTAAGPPKSEGKSAIVEKLATCSKEARKVRDNNSSRNSQLEHW